MRENSVKRAWRDGKVTYGAWLSIPSAFSAEVMAHQGFDWLCIDMQHGVIDYQVAVTMLQAISTTETIPFVRQRGARLISTDFRAGDLLVFGMFTLHGSLDNHSPIGRVRLSCDVRYQPAADPNDDARYFGPDPNGSQGGGYGDMKGAKPLTEPWSS